MKLTVFLGGLFSILMLLVGVVSWFSLDFSIQTSVLLGTEHHAAWTIAIMFGMILGVALVISLYVYRGVINPLLELRNKVARVAQGDFEISFESGHSFGYGNLEMRDLFVAFQSMTRNLRLMMETRDRTNADLRESEAKLHALFTAMMEMVVLHELVFDDQGEPVNYRITDCNHAFTSITGISREHALGCLATEVYGTKVAPYLKEYAQVALSGEPYRYETYFAPMDRHFVISVISPGKNRFATVTADVTERKRAEEAIQYLSFHDHLTGLHNRRFFDQEATRLDVPSNLPLSLIVLDVNGLKLTNDAFGHQAGDRLLQKVARILQDNCGSEDVLARVGGDEFLILLPRRDSAEAQELGERVCATLRSVEMVTGRISLAWGCATKSRQEESLQEIYRVAENRMYQGKIHQQAEVRRETMAFIMKTLYERAPWERHHSKRVGYLCGLLGRAMHLPSGEVEDLEVLGELHDIGKITLSSLILDKLEPLEPEEWEDVKLHPEAGYKILSSVNAWAALAEIVLAHHEHFDGTGYPKGLRGEEIPLKARILAVADAFDAMTWGRPYKKALSWKEAGEELQRCSDTQFDPRIVKVLLNLFHSGKIVFPESKGSER